MQSVRGQKSQRGSTMVEFALSASVFFLILFGGIDLVRVVYQALSLEYAAQRTGREIAVKNLQEGGAIAQRLAMHASSTSADISSSLCNLSSANCPLGTYENVADGQWFKLLVKTSVPILFGATHLHLSFESVARTEPDISRGLTLGN